ncbi:GHMP family kinase ATP-binding protein, partial [Faecalibacterium prausnitzii]|uniref:GHMP family kinase ATP-binding protein n=1 Tax=Faecalibacterium prausnitzii TaxID=853 RepID=UPI00383C920A|nr:hypothetical protein [Faecalibacterium prausnitzii]
DCRFYKGALDKASEGLHGIRACVKEILRTLKKPAENLAIKLESTIPIGRGLGSSAAVAVAIVRGLYAFFEKQLT